MTWSEAFRLSDVAYRELSLQAIFAFRQGNLPPSGSSHEVVARSRRRVRQSKLVISVVLALLAVGAAFLLRATALEAIYFPAGLPPGAFQAGVLTALLSLDVAFLWWTGMQVLPTFLGAGILPVLEPLPIDDRTLDRVAGILYVRLFDLPALTVLVVTPLAVALALGVGAALAVIPGVVAVIGFSLALSLWTGRFFVRRVQGSRGGGGRAVVRWAYLVLWLLPGFAMFAFVIVAPAFFSLLSGLAQAGPSPASSLLLVSFPYTFAALPALAASGPGGLGFSTTGLAVWLTAAAGYTALAAWSIGWVLTSVRRVGRVPTVDLAAVAVVRASLQPTGPVRSVLTKDLRIASRTPGYAFLILLPVLDAVAIGILTYVRAAGPGVADSIAFGAVMTSALLATFFGPAFFAIEVFAYSYGRTLPLSDRALVLGKVALVALVYLLSGGVVLGITLARIFDPVLFVGFMAAELPAVVAASLLELGILFRRARARNLPITNLYAGAWIAFLVAIPGVFVAAAPAVAFLALGGAGSPVGLLAMALVALGECGSIALAVLGRAAA